MTSRRIHVGQAALKGGLSRYAKVFDLLEVRCEPAPPSAKALRRLLGEAPDGFQFSLVAPRALAELAQAEPEASLVRATRTAAETLGARFVLLCTPASVTPSPRARARLERLVAALSGAAQALAWEPRGIWTDEEAEATAEALGLTLVRDLAEKDAPASDVVYTRLLALGRNARVTSSAIERVAERLEAASVAFVVVEGQGAVAVARALRANDESGADDEEDEEDEALDDGEDEDGEDEDELADVWDGEEGEDDGDDA